MTPSRSPILPALVVGLLAFAWLNHVHPPFAITNDGIRDQLLARDCTDLGRCHMIGANASVPGFHHGPVWLDLLAGVRLLGGDTTSQRTVVIVLMALSAFTLFIVVWRWLRPSLAVPATVLFLVGLTLDPSPGLLINPSITALPDVITVAGMLCYGLSGRFSFLVMASFALGAAITVHLGAAPLVASLVTIAGLVQRRALRGMTSAGTIVLVTYAVTSSAALRANAMALAQPTRLAVACAAAGLLALLCHRCGPAFRRLGWETRAWLIAALLIVPFALAALWLVTREQHQISFMYLHPVLASTAVCAAGLIVLPFEVGARWYRPLRWLPSAAAIALGSAAALLSFMRWPTQASVAQVREWTPGDAAAIAAHATQAGWQYEDMLFRLQSQSCLVLLTGMSPAAPPPRARESPDASHKGRVLQVVRGSHGELPRLATPHAMVVLDARTVAIVREMDSWMQPESLRACRRADAATPQCAPAHRKVIDTIGPQRFLFITRAFPEIHGLDVPPPYRATYEIPLVIAGSGTHDIAMLDVAPPDCGWHIVRADGVQVETELPARRARLRAESDARGVLVVEKQFGASACSVDDTDMRYPPCMFEATADDPLLALVTR